MRYALVLVLLSAHVAWAQRQPVPESWQVAHTGKGAIERIMVRDDWLFWCESTVVPGTEFNRAHTLDVKLMRLRLDDEDARPEFIASARETGTLPGMHPGPEGWLLWDSRGRNPQLSIPGNKPLPLSLDAETYTVSPQLLVRRGIVGHQYYPSGSVELVWRAFGDDHTPERETTVVARSQKLPDGTDAEFNPRLLSIDTHGPLLADDRYLVWTGQLARGKQYNLPMTGVWRFKEQKEAWLLPGIPLVLTDDYVYSQAPHFSPESPWIVRRHVADGQNAEGWRDEGNAQLMYASADEVLVLALERGERAVRRYDFKQKQKMDLDLGWRGSGWEIALAARPGFASAIAGPGFRRGVLLVDPKRKRFLAAIEAKLYTIPFKPVGDKTDLDLKWTTYEELGF